MRAEPDTTPPPRRLEDDMSKWVFAALIAIACATGASAQDRRYDAAATDNTKYSWADVLRVDPVYDYVRSSSPREECYDSQIERRDTRGNNAGATILGAVIGGALGNTVGKGDGRKAATIAGAVVGGAVGNNAARGDDRYYTDTERRCRVVEGVAEERRIVGYDVEYRYRGDVYNSRLDYDPGERIRVRVSVTPAE